MTSIFQKKYFKVPLVSLIIFTLTFQMVLFSPEKAQAVASTKKVDYFDYCEPKIPLYDRSYFELEEKYNACRILKEIQDRAYQEILTSKKIEEITDPWGGYDILKARPDLPPLDINQPDRTLTCNPLKNCGTQCTLRLPAFSIKVDVTEVLACLFFPETCPASAKEFIEVWKTVKTIYDIFKTIDDILTWIDVINSIMNAIISASKIAGYFLDLVEEVKNWDFSELEEFRGDVVNFTMIQKEARERIEAIIEMIKKTRKGVAGELSPEELKILIEKMKEMGDILMETYNTCGVAGKEDLMTSYVRQMRLYMCNDGESCEKSSLHYYLKNNGGSTNFPTCYQFDSDINSLEQKSRNVGFSIELNANSIQQLLCPLVGKERTKLEEILYNLSIVMGSHMRKDIHYAKLDLQSQFLPKITQCRDEINDPLQTIPPTEKEKALRYLRYIESVVNQTIKRIEEIGELDDAIGARKIESGDWEFWTSCKGKKDNERCGECAFCYQEKCLKYYWQYSGESPGCLDKRPEEVKVCNPQNYDYFGFGGTSQAKSCGETRWGLWAIGGAPGCTEKEHQDVPTYRCQREELKIDEDWKHFPVGAYLTVNLMFDNRIIPALEGILDKIEKGFELTLEQETDKVKKAAEEIKNDLTQVIKNLETVKEPFGELVWVQEDKNETKREEAEKAIKEIIEEVKKIRDGEEGEVEGGAKISIIDKLKNITVKLMGVIEIIKGIGTIDDILDEVEKLKKNIEGAISGIKKTQESKLEKELPDYKKIKDKAEIDILDACVSHPAFGIDSRSSEKGGRVCPDLTILYNDLSGSFASVLANFNKIRDIERELKKPEDKEQVTIVKEKAEEIWQKSLNLYGLISAFKFMADRCTCGRSNCLWSLCLNNLHWVNLDAFLNPYCLLTWFSRFFIQGFIKDLAITNAGEWEGPPTPIISPPPPSPPPTSTPGTPPAPPPTPGRWVPYLTYDFGEGGLSQGKIVFKIRGLSDVESEKGALLFLTGDKYDNLSRSSISKSAIQLRKHKKVGIDRVKFIVDTSKASSDCYLSTKNEAECKVTNVPSWDTNKEYEVTLNWGDNNYNVVLKDPNDVEYRRNITGLQGDFQPRTFGLGWIPSTDPKYTKPAGVEFLLVSYPPGKEISTQPPSY